MISTIKKDKCVTGLGFWIGGCIISCIIILYRVVREVLTEDRTQNADTLR